MDGPVLKVDRFRRVPGHFEARGVGTKHTVRLVCCEGLSTRECDPISQVECLPGRCHRLASTGRLTALLVLAPQVGSTPAEPKGSMCPVCCRGIGYSAALRVRAVAFLRFRSGRCVLRGAGSVQGSEHLRSCL